MIVIYRWKAGIVDNLNIKFQHFIHHLVVYNAEKLGVNDFR